MRQFVQSKCMTRWRDTDQVGVRELQRLAFRDDVVSCADAKEVLAKVRKDAHALGFFACRGPLTKRDLQGVKALPIAVKEGDQAVAPPLDLASERAYPLAEPLVLYVHPNAPVVARDFCKFATGPEAAKIVQQFGIWPEYPAEQARAEQRLAEVKAGKGKEIVVCDLTGKKRLLKDLALEFVKAKAAVQLRLQEGDAWDNVTGKGFKGGSELLLTDRPLPTVRGGRPELVASATDTGSKLPQSVELGRMAVGIIVHPKNMLNSLPLNELRGILCGEIRQWPGANGSADTMHVYGPHADDAVVQLLKEKIGDMSLKYHVLPDNQKVILEIARDSAAIGFVDLSQLSPDEKSVKLVDVYLPGQPNQAKTSAKDANRAKQGAEGEGQSSPQSFAHRLTSLAACGLPEDYPLVRTFTFYASPRASEAAKDFAQFVASDHCATTLIQHNLLPPLYAAPDRGTTAPEKPPKTCKPYLGSRR